MRLTHRGKRRLIIVSVVSVALVATLASLWMFRNVYRSRLADEACAVGLEAYARGDYETALAELSYCLSYNKENVESLLAFADTRSRISEVNSRHLKSAVRYYEAVLKLEPLNIQALDAQLHLYRRLGRRLELGLVADRILSINSDHISALQAKATIAYRDHSFEDVIKQAEHLSAIQPDELRWRALIIRAFQGQDADVDSVLDLCDKWITESELDGRFYILKAQTLLEYGMIDKARVELELAVALGTGSKQILSVMMSLLDQFDLKELAKNLLVTTKAKYPMQPWVYEAAVRWHWQAMRLDDAAREISESENEILVASSELLRWKALIHSANGEIKKANASLDELVALTIDKDAQTRDSTRGWVEAIKARLRVSEQNWREGIDAYQNALALEPNDAILEYLLAEAYQHIGEHNLAIMGLMRAKRIDPYWISIPIALAKSLVKLDRHAEAVGVLKRVIQRTPESGLSTYVLLGQAWLKTQEAVGAGNNASSNDRNSALIMQGLFEELLVKFPNDPDVVHILAELHARYGLVEEAEKLIVKAISDEETQPRTCILLAQLSVRWKLGYMDKLLDKAKQHPNLSIKLAGQISLLLFNQGQSDAARRFFNKFVAASSTTQRSDAQITIMRVQLLLSLNDQDAHGKIIQLLSSEPKSLAAAEFALGLSQTWEDSELIQSAIDILVTQLGEQSPRVMLAKATKIYQFEKDNPASIASATILARDALQYTSDSKHALTLMSALLLVGDNPRYSQAITHLKRAINLYPSDTSLYPKLIVLLRRVGDNEEAREYLRRLSLYPNLDPQTKRAEIILLQIQGDLEAAIDRITQFTGESLSELEMTDLATMYAQIGKHEEASAIFHQLMNEPNPGKIAVNVAADFYAETGRFQQGLQLIEKLTARFSIGEKYIQLGAFHQKHGEYDEAYKLYLKAAEAAPKNIKVWNTLAAFLLATGQPEKAVKAALAGRDVEPDNQTIQATLAFAILGSKDATPQQALELVNNLGSGNEPLKDTFNLFLRLNNDKGQLDPTKRDLSDAQQLVKDHSQFLPAWQLTVTLHAQAGQVDEALRLANRALKLLPGRSEPAQWAAHLLHDTGRLRESIIAAQTWLQRTRIRRIEPEAFIAAVQLRLDNPQLAAKRLIPHANRIWSERANKSHRVLLLLNVYLAIDDTTQAGLLINKMAGDSLNWWDQLLSLALLLDAQYGYEILDLMEGVFVKTSTDCLRLAMTWSNFARSNKELSSYDRAENLIQAAETKGASTADIELLRGIIAAGRGDSGSAQQHYRNVLNADPNHVAALNNLAYVLINLGNRYDEALALTQRAVKIDPESAAILDTHARALLGVGQLDDAKQAINTALENAKNSPTFSLTLTRILIAQEEYEQAENELSRVKLILQEAARPNKDLQAELQQLLELLPTASTSAQ